MCHAKIQSFEFIIELLVHYLSHQKWWTPTNGVKYSKEEKQSYHMARAHLKDKLWDNLEINIGDPGDMVTGSAFQTFSCDPSRAFLANLVQDELQEDFSGILLGLCATVKVINSHKRKVNIEKLQQLTMETYMKLVTCFPWCVVSPSVHRILAHSWEVIQGNNGCGLGSLSEEGLEALNKYIRSMRETGA